MPDLVKISYAPERTSDIHPWQQDAACLDEDPEVFFPDIGDVRTALKAAEWCAICPVAKQCLAYALENNIEHGVFGGVSARGRRTYTYHKNEERQVNRQRVITMTAQHMTAAEISQALGISMRQVTRLRSKKAS